MLQKTSHFLRQANLIGGEWVQADSGATIDVINPATGLKIGTVPKSGKAETRRAIEAADAAFQTWRKTTRAGALASCCASCMTPSWTTSSRWPNCSPPSRASRWPNRRARSRSRPPMCCGSPRKARRTYGDIVPSPWKDRRILVTKEPIGVIAAITPWNFPSSMLSRKIGPALAAGCTAVIKPASQTPYSGLAWGVLCEEVGFPKGVVNIVTGSAGEIGDEICANPLVRKLTFTGSTEVGKMLIAKCAADA